MCRSRWRYQGLPPLAPSHGRRAGEACACHPTARTFVSPERRKTFMAVFDFSRFLLYSQAQDREFRTPRGVGEQKSECLHTHNNSAPAYLAHLSTGAHGPPSTTAHRPPPPAGGTKQLPPTSPTPSAYIVNCPGRNSPILAVERPARPYTAAPGETIHCVER